MVTIELLGPLGNKSLTSEAKNFYELKQELQKDTEIQKWLQHCAMNCLSERETGEVNFMEILTKRTGNRMIAA